MATFNKYNCFVENLAEGVHNLQSNALTIGLSNTAPNASTHTVLADAGAISYTNLSGSRVLTSVTSSQTSGTYTLDAADVTLTATGTVATFRYVFLYNDTPTSPADPLIGWYDYGSALALTSGESITISFSGSGILTLA